MRPQGFLEKLGCISKKKEEEGEEEGGKNGVHLCSSGKAIIYPGQRLQILSLLTLLNFSYLDNRNSNH